MRIILKYQIVKAFSAKRRGFAKICSNFFFTIFVISLKIKFRTELLNLDYIVKKLVIRLFYPNILQHITVTKLLQELLNTCNELKFSMHQSKFIFSTIQWKKQNIISQISRNQSWIATRLFHMIDHQCSESRSSDVVFDELFRNKWLERFHHKKEFCK